MSVIDPTRGSAYKVELRGITWDHSRGYDPMVATARAYEATHSGVRITWEKRPLQAFADFPIAKLADQYDLIVLDHPHVGTVAREHSAIALDEVLPAETLEVLAAESVGCSHTSYAFDGHQWALAIDAAAQVAAYRGDLLSSPPRTWSEVIALARTGAVLWPAKPVDALMSFFTLAANRGTPCFATSAELISREAGLAVLADLSALGQAVPPECFALNPIQVFDRMSSEATIAYCPLLYGYSNYAREGFRQHVIRFANIPAVGSDGPLGSTIGGAGLAISVRTQALEPAVEYAVWVASAECQVGLYFESGGQPGNALAWSNDAVNAAANNFFNDTRETLDRAWLRPRYDGYMEFQARGGTLVNALLAGRSGPEDTLRDLDRAYLDSLHASR